MDGPPRKKQRRSLMDFGLKFNVDQEPLQVVKVISGGQTGADIVALRAARDAGLETGGFAAARFWTEAGAQRALLEGEFNMASVPNGYKERTKMNVDKADCTVAFLAKTQGGSGTSKTIGYAATGKWCDLYSSSTKGYKPVLVLSAADMKDPVMCAATLTRWLGKVKAQIVNIAGHRTSVAKDLRLDFDYETRCREILLAAFQQKKPEVLVQSV